MQMYKNTIFDPLNLSSIGENAPLIEEKKIDFSLENFKSNISVTQICVLICEKIK